MSTFPPTTSDATTEGNQTVNANGSVTAVPTSDLSHLFAVAPSDTSPINSSSNTPTNVAMLLTPHMRAHSGTAIHSNILTSTPSPLHSVVSPFHSSHSHPESALSHSEFQSSPSQSQSQSQSQSHLLSPTGTMALSNSNSPNLPFSASHQHHQTMMALHAALTEGRSPTIDASPNTNTSLAQAQQQHQQQSTMTFTRLPPSTFSARSNIASTTSNVTNKNSAPSTAATRSTRMNGASSALSSSVAASVLGAAGLASRSAPSIVPPAVAVAASGIAPSPSSSLVSAATILPVTMTSFPSPTTTPSADLVRQQLLAFKSQLLDRGAAFEQVKDLTQERNLLRRRLDELEREFEQMKQECHIREMAEMKLTTELSNMRLQYDQLQTTHAGTLRSFEDLQKKFAEQARIERMLPTIRMNDGHGGGGGNGNVISEGQLALLRQQTARANEERDKARQECESLKARHKEKLIKMRAHFDTLRTISQESVDAVAKVNDKMKEQAIGWKKEKRTLEERIEELEEECKQQKEQVESFSYSSSPAALTHSRTTRQQQSNQALFISSLSKDVGAPPSPSLSSTVVPKRRGRSGKNLATDSTTLEPNSTTTTTTDGAPATDAAIIPAVKVPHLSRNRRITAQERALQQLVNEQQKLLETKLAQRTKEILESQTRHHQQSSAMSDADEDQHLFDEEHGVHTDDMMDDEAASSATSAANTPTQRPSASNAPSKSPPSLLPAPAIPVGPYNPSTLLALTLKKRRGRPAKTSHAVQPVPSATSIVNTATTAAISLEEIANRRKRTRPQTVTQLLQARRGTTANKGKKRKIEPSDKSESHQEQSNPQEQVEGAKGADYDDLFGPDHDDDVPVVSSVRPSASDSSHPFATLVQAIGVEWLDEVDELDENASDEEGDALDRHPIRLMKQELCRTLLQGTESEQVSDPESALASSTRSICTPHLPRLLFDIFLSILQSISQLESYAYSDSALLVPSHGTLHLIRRIVRQFHNITALIQAQWIDRIDSAPSACDSSSTICGCSRSIDLLAQLQEACYTQLLHSQGNTMEDAISDCGMMKFLANEEDEENYRRHQQSTNRLLIHLIAHRRYAPLHLIEMTMDKEHHRQQQQPVHGEDDDDDDLHATSMFHLPARLVSCSHSSELALSNTFKQRVLNVGLLPSSISSVCTQCLSSSPSSPYHLLPQTIHLILQKLLSPFTDDILRLRAPRLYDFIQEKSDAMAGESNPPVLISTFDDLIIATIAAIELDSTDASLSDDVILSIQLLAAVCGFKQMIALVSHIFLPIYESTDELLRPRWRQFVSYIDKLIQSQSKAS